MADHPWWDMMGPIGDADKRNKAKGGKKNSSAPGGTGGPADQQTQANRPNQTSPYGSTTWHQNPDGSWGQSNSFTPGLEGANSQLQAQMSSNYAHGLGNGDQARDQAIKAAYGQSVSRLDPQWAQREQQQNSSLANQGLDPNSEAFKNSMQGFNFARNDAYQGAMNNAIGQGTAAQQATFGENLAAYNNPLQQMSLMHGLLNMPGYSGAGDYGQQYRDNQQMTADAIKAGGQLATGLGGLAPKGGGETAPAYQNPAGYDAYGYGNYPGASAPVAAPFTFGKKGSY